MAKKRGLSPRVRLTGLLASVMAVVALGLTVLAGNNNVGFGHSVTRAEQASLLVLAVLLLAVQAVAYLIHRARRPTKSAADRTQSSTLTAKNRSRGDL
jgi:hypothetical protein